MSSRNTWPATTPSSSAKWSPSNPSMANLSCTCGASTAGSSLEKQKALSICPGLKTQHLKLTILSPLRTSARPRRLCRISQFFPVALHFAQRVDRFVQRFVIRPRGDFAEQPNRNQLNAAQKRHSRQQQQRPVFCNDVRVQ